MQRREFLNLSTTYGASLLLSGCAASFLADPVGRLTEPLNQKIEELLLKPQTPIPDLPTSLIQPEKLLVNTYGFTPQIDRDRFRLIIDGEVNQPLQLSLDEIYKLPFRSMVMRHVCVEGWAAVVQWGGVPLSELIRLAQPKEGVRYAYFQSADRYYESWDIASCLHPQTLLVYRKNGEELPVENGAPLRLAAPIKLAYKHSKWVTRVTLLSKLSQYRGYWEDQGYEWFAGT